MKRVEIKNNVIIETPWLRPEEAAAYCGMSRSAFDEWSQKLGVKRSGAKRAPTYHVEKLDAFVVQLHESLEDKRRVPRISAKLTRIIDREVKGILNPRTGKLHLPPQLKGKS